MLLTLKPYGICKSKFAYIFILILCSHPGMQNGDMGLPSTILAGQGFFSENAHNS